MRFVNSKFEISLILLCMHHYSSIKPASIGSSNTPISFPYSRPWDAISPHIRLNEIFEGVEGLVKESPSTNQRLQEYLDQYIKVLEEDRTRFIDKVQKFSLKIPEQN